MTRPRSRNPVKAGIQRPFTGLRRVAKLLPNAHIAGPGAGGGSPSKGSVPRPENCTRRRGSTPLTYAGYKVNVEKHLVPTLGKVALDQLTPRHVQEMINSRLTAGFSGKSVAYMHQVLRTALGLAVRWDMASRNVARLVDRPRIERKPIQPLSPYEARKFFRSHIVPELEREAAEKIQAVLEP